MIKFIIFIIALCVIIPPAYAHHTGLESGLLIIINYYDKIAFSDHEFSFNLNTCDKQYVICYNRNVLQEIPLKFTIMKEIPKYEYNRSTGHVIKTTSEEFIESFESTSNKLGYISHGVKLGYKYDSNFKYNMIIEGEGDKKIISFWITDRSY